jgi:hypothetical protein
VAVDRVPISKPEDETKTGTNGSTSSASAAGGSR